MFFAYSFLNRSLSEEYLGLSSQGGAMSSLPTAVYWVVSGIVLHFLKEQYLKTVQKFRDELKRELLGKKTAGAALLANYEKRGKHLARIRKLYEWLDTLAYVVVIATLIWNIFGTFVDFFDKPSC